MVETASHKGSDFRLDINGLRAIAAVAVVIFHFTPKALPGGFAGVDIFYVISGYLMTRIIQTGLDRGGFSILAFYGMRARRIWPVLALVCLGVLALGWFILLPDEYRMLSVDVAASLSFLSNIVYWRDNVGYFGPNAHENWLLHSWTLSVEWQFYMLYPLALIALRRIIGPPNVRWAILLGCGAGFAFSLWISFVRADIAFFLLPARAWEMLLGGVAFLFPVTRAPRHARPYAWAGLLLIVLGLAVVDEHDAWPGYLALLPTLGTFAVIHAGGGGLAVTDNRLSQWLGTRSFSLYMWHWPLVVLLYFTGRLNDPAAAAGAVAALVAISIASYRFVETDFRAYLSRPGKAWPALGTLFAVPLALAGGVWALHGAVPGRSAGIAERAAFVVRYDMPFVGNDALFRRQCDFYAQITRTGRPVIDRSCVVAHAGTDGGVFLWGDSHAAALSPGLVAILPPGTPFNQVTSSGCRPGLVRDADAGPFLLTTACDVALPFALRAIAAIKPRIVVIAMRADHDKRDLGALAAHLHRIGVGQVVVVGPLTGWTTAPSKVIARRHWRGGDWIADGAIDWTFRETDTALKRQLRQADVHFISLADQLCQERRCRVRLPGGALLQENTMHLTPEGSRFVARTILLPRLAPLLTIPKLDSGQPPR